MKKKILTFTLVPLVGSFALFGVKDTLRRITVSAGQLRTEINENTSTQHLIALAKAQLAAADEMLFEAEVEAKQRRERTEKIESRIHTLTKMVDSSRSRLARLQPAIEGKTQFIYAGCRYTQQEVTLEGQRLVAKITSTENELEAERAALKANRKAVAITTSKLNEAKGRVIEERNALRVLGVQIQTEEAIAAASAAIPDASDVVDGSYAETKNILEKRMLKLQKNNASMETIDHHGIVPWGTETTESNHDLAYEVREILGTSSEAPKTARVASQENDGAGCDR